MSSKKKQPNPHGRFEPLREEFKPYLQEYDDGELWIRHEFCNQPIRNLDKCAAIHEQIARRTAIADNCFESHDYVGYIEAIEVPFQAEWLEKDAEFIPDHCYWPLVAKVYQNLSVTVQYRDVVERLLRADRPGRERLMSTEEQATLARLPKMLQVYRGYSGECLYADGVAWTLDRREAIWCANSMLDDDDVMLASGTIPKDRVWAYFASGTVLLPSEAVTNRHDVDAFDEAARVPWSDFVAPDFDVTPMFER